MEQCQLLYRLNCVVLRYTGRTMTAVTPIKCVVLRNKGGTMPADKILKSVVPRYTGGKMCRLEV